MNIIVTGSSGLIGSALVPFLMGAGHRVIPLRRPADWDPEKAKINLSVLEGAGAVVHLAGENIAGGRWTEAKKARIRTSRINGTTQLSAALANLQKPPAVLVSASAIGYYGDRGSERLREESTAGSGFLADVCRQWEAAAEGAARAGIRVVQLRIGVVLSAKGGALAKMLVPFRLGVGGKVGPGTQYWSWIALDDLCSVILHATQVSDLRGPVNAVSPQSVTNEEFTKTLGRVLRRPTVFPMPAFLARAALGEMADALLLASARVEPAKLSASRFGFKHGDLESALRALF